MFKIKMAGAIPEIDNRCDHVRQYCEGWMTDASPCFRVKVTQSELDEYIKNCHIPDMTEDVAERVLIYRKIAARLATGGRFLLHSALIDYENNGIAFVAKRGVGKTTHALLWKEAFPEKVKFVNGDKPIVRKKGETQCVGFVAGFLEDRFALDGQPVLEPAIRLTGEVLLDPLTENGIFCEDFVVSEGANQADLIRSQINDKRGWSIHRVTTMSFSLSRYSFPK